MAKLSAAHIFSIPFGLICFFLFTTIHLEAQIEHDSIQNNSRLNLIPKLLAEAEALQNYSAAAKLQQEDNLRKKLNTAYRNSSQSRIIELENELHNCKCIIQQVESIKAEKPLSDSAALVQIAKNRYRNRTFERYFNFSPFSYIAGSYQENAYDYDPTWGYGTLKHHQYGNRMIGGGFRLGGTFFFKGMKEKQSFKVGFDLVFISFTAGMNMMTANGGATYFGIAQPGIVLRKYINETSGFNLKMNLGNSLIIAKFFNVGYCAKAVFSYWVKNVKIGIEYQFVGSLNNIVDMDRKSQINQLGLVCGFNF